MQNTTPPTQALAQLLLGMLPTGRLPTSPVAATATPRAADGRSDAAADARLPFQRVFADSLTKPLPTGLPDLSAGPTTDAVSESGGAWPAAGAGSTETDGPAPLVLMNPHPALADRPTAAAGAAQMAVPAPSATRETAPDGQPDVSTRATPGGEPLPASVPVSGNGLPVRALPSSDVMATVTSGPTAERPPIMPMPAPVIAPVTAADIAPVTGQDAVGAAGPAPRPLHEVSALPAQPTQPTQLTQVTPRDGAATVALSAAAAPDSDPAAGATASDVPDRSALARTGPAAANQPGRMQPMHQSPGTPTPFNVADAASAGPRPDGMPAPAIGTPGSSNPNGAHSVIQGTGVVPGDGATATAAAASAAAATAAAATAAAATAAAATVQERAFLDRMLEADVQRAVRTDHSGAVNPLPVRRAAGDALLRRLPALSESAESTDGRPGGGLEPRELPAMAVTARPLMAAGATRDLGALAERIEMLLARGGGSARIHLNLGELGDVEVSVRMEARDTHVRFVVQDAAVRDALDAQLPRLRQMLEDSGLRLGDVSTGLPGGSAGDTTGRNPFGGRPSDGERRLAQGAPRPSLDDAGQVGSGAGSRHDSQHLLDAFA